MRKAIHPSPFLIGGFCLEGIRGFFVELEKISEFKEFCG
jgi:hypothetical protein